MSKSIRAVRWSARRDPCLEIPFFTGGISSVSDAIYQNPLTWSSTAQSDLSVWCLLLAFGSNVPQRPHLHFGTPAFIPLSPRMPICLLTTSTSAPVEPGGEVQPGSSAEREIGRTLTGQFYIVAFVYVNKSTISKPRYNANRLFFIFQGSSHHAIV